MSNSKIPISYATPSLGMHPSHTLTRKLNAIASADYDGIELGFDDLLAFTRDFLQKPDLAEDDYDSICHAAREVRNMCEAKQLTVLVLQPFSNFEGYTGEKRKQVFEKAAGWKRVMDVVGCGMLQVGSNDDPSSSSDPEVIAKDLAELADLIFPAKVAYENWCWGAHVNTWAGCYSIITRANRSNLGLCLDTFQTAGLEWADPTSQTGKIENAEKVYQESLQRLKETVPKDKIFFFQISDAFKMDPPMEANAVEGTPPRGRWSHGSRPPPGQNGYLPVQEMVDAVLATGFRGWFSVEVFLEEEHGKEYEEGLEERWAKEGMESVKALLKE